MNAPAGRRILLIDDMPSIHEDFRKILVTPAQPADDIEAALFGSAKVPVQESFELDCAHQGREGAAMVEAALREGRPYAIAFVDMRMPPGWDGVETIEQLWRIDPRLQAVICTAHSDHAWEDVLTRLDVRDRLLILKKPFDVIEIRQTAAMLAAKWSLEIRNAAQIHALEGFAQAVSHDLRAPLISVSAFSKLLASELAGSADARVSHYLERIMAGAALGEELMEGLLCLNRIALMQVRPEMLDLAPMATDLLDGCRARDPARAVHVTVQQDLLVQGDRRLLRMAMGHLLDNAWKFTARSTVARIEVGCVKSHQDEPVFFVRDDGIGFDMADAGTLFGSFQKLHPAQQFPGRGAGVGLVTASRALSRLGGRIWADSRPGAGTTISFTLPVPPAGMDAP